MSVESPSSSASSSAYQTAPPSRPPTPEHPRPPRQEQASADETSEIDVAALTNWVAGLDIQLGSVSVDKASKPDAETSSAYRTSTASSPTMRASSPSPQDRTPNVPSTSKREQLQEVHVQTAEQRKESPTVPDPHIAPTPTMSPHCPPTTKKWSETFGLSSSPPPMIAFNVPHEEVETHIADALRPTRPPCPPRVESLPSWPSSPTPEAEDDAKTTPQRGRLPSFAMNIAPSRLDCERGPLRATSDGALEDGETGEWLVLDDGEVEVGGSRSVLPGSSSRAGSYLPVSGLKRWMRKEEEKKGLMLPEARNGEEDGVSMKVGKWVVEKWTGKGKEDEEVLEEEGKKEEIDLDEQRFIEERIGAVLRRDSTGPCDQNWPQIIDKTIRMMGVRWPEEGEKKFGLEWVQRACGRVDRQLRELVLEWGREMTTYEGKV